MHVNDATNRMNLMIFALAFIFAYISNNRIHTYLKCAYPCTMCVCVHGSLRSSCVNLLAVRARNTYKVRGSRLDFSGRYNRESQTADIMWFQTRAITTGERIYRYHCWWPDLIILLHITLTSCLLCFSLVMFAVSLLFLFFFWGCSWTWGACFCCRNVSL